LAGPLSKIEAEALFESSAAQTAKATAATPDSFSLGQVILPALDSPSLKSLARIAQVGAGVTLEDLSAKWAGFGRAFGGADGFPVGGYDVIVARLADEVREAGGTIRLGEEVVKVEDLGVGKGVRVRTRQGDAYEAKTVLSTLPLGVLQNVDEAFFAPALSAPLASAIERTTVGTLEKIILSYDAAWWPEPDAHGTYILLPTVTDGSTPTSLSGLFSRTTIPVMNFVHSGTSAHATLLAYVGATAGVFLASYSAEDQALAMHKYLIARLAPKQDPPAFATSEVTSWLTDPFSRGATSAPTTLARSADGVQASPLDLVVLGRSEWDGRLGFAGEHTELVSSRSRLKAWRCVISRTIADQVAVCGAGHSGIGRGGGGQWPTRGPQAGRTPLAHLKPTNRARLPVAKLESQYRT